MAMRSPAEYLGLIRKQGSGSSEEKSEDEPRVEHCPGSSDTCHTATTQSTEPTIYQLRRLYAESTLTYQFENYTTDVMRNEDNGTNGFLEYIVSDLLPYTSLKANFENKTSMNQANQYGKSRRQQTVNVILSQYLYTLNHALSKRMKPLQNLPEVDRPCFLKKGRHATNKEKQDVSFKNVNVLTGANPISSR